MLQAPGTMPQALCYRLYATGSMPQAQGSMFHATFYMLHAICYMLHATCHMIHAPCLLLPPRAVEGRELVAGFTGTYQGAGRGGDAEFLGAVFTLEPLSGALIRERHQGKGIVHWSWSCGSFIVIIN